jgi:hypothetical protein
MVMQCINGVGSNPVDGRIKCSQLSYISIADVVAWSKALDIMLSD